MLQADFTNELNDLESPRNFLKLNSTVESLPVTFGFSRYNTWYWVVVFRDTDENDDVDDA